MEPAASASPELADTRATRSSSPPYDTIYILYRYTVSLYSCMHMHRKTYCKDAIA